MDRVTHPLTLDRWPDLEALFLAKGCSMARSCWCMYYRESGKVGLPPGLTVGEHRRRRLRELAAGDPPPGLVGYRGGVPVGWVCLGLRVAFPRLRRSPVAKAVGRLWVDCVLCCSARLPAPGRGERASAGRDCVRPRAGRGGARGVPGGQARPSLRCLDVERSAVHVREGWARGGGPAPPRAAPGPAHAPPCLISGAKNASLGLVSLTARRGSSFMP